jgi:hypothetical protein
MFNNPIIHDEIRTCEPTTLSASEAIVIYRIKRNKQTMSNGLNQDHKLDLELGNISKGSLESLGKDVERIIIRGPRQYIEQPNEWMHEFKWHGSSEKSDYDSGKTKKVFSLI